MVLSAQSIRKIGTQLFDPFVERTVDPESGMSYGLSACSYDVRLDQDLVIPPGEFKLGSTVERIRMMNHLVGIVHDKSTNARLGIALQNTLIDAGWEGYLTLEISNHTPFILNLKRGRPIAQIMFHLLDEPTDQPYDGKYQNQEQGPQQARFEFD